MKNIGETEKLDLLIKVMAALILIVLIIICAIVLSKLHY